MSEEGLLQLEKSIGTAVAKAKNYYDARIKLRDAKEVLVKARHRFECAQALHVAAKELADASVINKQKKYTSIEILKLTC